MKIRLAQGYFVVNKSRLFLSGLLFREQGIGFREQGIEGLRSQFLRSPVSRRTKPNLLMLCPQKPGILSLKLHNPNQRRQVNRGILVFAGAVEGVNGFCKLGDRNVFVANTVGSGG